MGDKNFNKTDMDRLGFFSEPEYISIGDKYVSRKFGGNFNEAAGKGKQLLPGGNKDISATQAGYFSDKYGRVFEGESYTDQVKNRRQYRLKQKQRNLSKDWVPSSGNKKPSGAGSHYGTISGPVEHLSPLTKAGKPYKAPGKNLYTNPGKKGSGFGYQNLTLGPYPSHDADSYDKTREIVKKERELHYRNMKDGAFKLNMHPKSYFDENPFKSDRPLGPPKKDVLRKAEGVFHPSSPGKKDGGMKAGTFEAYPSHSTDLYTGVKMHKVTNEVNKSGKTYYPNQGPKSTVQRSVVNQNVTRSINRQNFRQITSVMQF